MKRGFFRKTPAASLIFSFSLCFLILPCYLYAQNKGSKWEPPPEAANIKNPLAGNEASIKDGKVLYVGYCVPCHGDKGRGDGVAAAGLAIKPADHSSAAVQSQADGSLFWELSEGHNPMPSYKQALSETQRWQLVNYIRTLAKPQKKS
jgi:mono/diheme cytochrome c family protein